MSLIVAICVWLTVPISEQQERWAIRVVLATAFCGLLAILTLICCKSYFFKGITDLNA
jgi:hypothetical protein